MQNPPGCQGAKGATLPDACSYSTMWFNTQKGGVRRPSDICGRATLSLDRVAEERVSSNIHKLKGSRVDRRRESRAHNESNVQMVGFSLAVQVEVVSY